MRGRRHDLQPVGGIDRHHLPGRGHLDRDRQAGDAQALDAQGPARRVGSGESTSRPFVFVIFQRYFTQGANVGAEKG